MVFGISSRWEPFFRVLKFWVRGGVVCPCSCSLCPRLCRASVHPQGNYTILAPQLLRTTVFTTIKNYTIHSTKSMPWQQLPTPKSNRYSHCFGFSAPAYFSLQKHQIPHYSYPQQSRNSTVTVNTWSWHCYHHRGQSQSRYNVYRISFGCIQIYVQCVRVILKH